jgi:hypothetical protein
MHLLRHYQYLTKEIWIISVATLPALKPKKFELFAFVAITWGQRNLNWTHLLHQLNLSWNLSTCLMRITSIGTKKFELLAPDAFIPIITKEIWVISIYCDYQLGYHEIWLICICCDISALLPIKFALLAFIAFLPTFWPILSW